MNNIASQVLNFLEQFPPFSYLSNSDLIDLTLQSKIIYLDKNQILFKSGDRLHDNFYVIKTGTVGLSITSDIEETIIDKCIEGDILGLRPYFAKENYLMSAKAKETSIIYAIPFTALKKYALNYPNVQFFFLQSFATHTRNPFDTERRGKLISENTIYNDKNIDIQYFLPIKYSKSPITANPEDVVRHIAKTMANSEIGSVIIQENSLPIGIITDKDLRKKIATGSFPLDTEISKIMSSPVITVPENISVAEAQIMMLKHSIGHLCVTKDGTDNTPVTGIISEHDVVAAQSNTPGFLLKQAKRANSYKHLKHVREKLTDLIQNFIDKEIPLLYLSNIVTDINRAIIRRAIELGVQSIGTPPPTRFLWMNIGSQGRKEQLGLTDQDNALIFEDVSEEEYSKVKAYFLNLASRVTAMLNAIGYEYCQHNLMANNPKWCNSITDWKMQYENWINTPVENNVNLSTVFFDYDFVNAAPELEVDFNNNIFQNINQNTKFFAHLANDTLKNLAPLGLFRQFLLENEGEHKDTFDIKNRALEPLIDAGRLLALSQGIKATNTYKRFMLLAKIETQNQELYEDCAEAFNTLMYFRTKEGMLYNTDGRYLNINKMSKPEKIKLKSCFQPINDVNDLIKNRFSLTYIT